MKTSKIIKLTMIVMATFFAHTGLHAQATEKKLLGCWILDRFEFLSPTEDSTEIVKQEKHIITCFEEAGKFITKQKTGTDEKVINTGTYSLSADGKFISQDDSKAEIVTLNDTDFDIKMEDSVIIHFKRIPVAK